MAVSLIKPSFWGKFFSPIKLITLNKENVIFDFKNKTSTTYSLETFSDFPESTENFFGASLSLKLNKKHIKYSMLNQFDVKQAVAALDKIATNYLETSISKSGTLFHTLGVKEYLRDSNVDFIDSSNKELIESYIASKAIWKTKLNEGKLKQLDALVFYYPLVDKKEELRRSFEKNRLLSRKQFFDKIESNPLTEQQRLAVIRNNDRNLVLAAAGTGKTSVIVAKALDLIESGMATSEEILVLAYSKKAADELKDRLSLRSQESKLDLVEPPSISTFHALGRKILKDAQVVTYLSDFAQDSKKLEKWVSDWLESYIQSSPRSLLKFIQLCYQPINPFDFKSKEEYDNYVRDNEYRTLQGERVRGYQELLIANWLFLNGVNYKYESPYVSKRRIRPEFDYTPDFYLKDADIYLEHFGIDRNGKTRADIDLLNIIKKWFLNVPCISNMVPN